MALHDAAEALKRRAKLPHDPADLKCSAGVAVLDDGNWTFVEVGGAHVFLERGRAVGPVFRQGQAADPPLGDEDSAPRVTTARALPGDQALLLGGTPRAVSTSPELPSLSSCARSWRAAKHSPGRPSRPTTHPRLWRPSSWIVGRVEHDLSCSPCYSHSLSWWLPSGSPSLPGREDRPDRSSRPRREVRTCCPSLRNPKAPASMSAGLPAWWISISPTSSRAAVQAASR